MNQTQTKIVLTGGGSGGHITPLLSLARALKKSDPGCSVIYVGWRGEKSSGNHMLADYFDEQFFVSAGKFRRYHGESFLSHLLDVKTLALNTRDFFRVISGTISSWWLLGRIKPAVVFSKGGFVAVPVGVAAHFRGISIITHDSDTVAGLANRIIGRWAKVRAVGQPLDHYKQLPPKAQFTGIPIDESFKPVNEKAQQSLKRSLGLPTRSQVLLIAGGGLGSESINNLALASVPGLLGHYPNLNVVHVTGPAHQEKIRSLYNIDPADSNRLKIFGYSSDYKDFAAASDLVISRAGATAMAELAALHKPVILMPASHLADGHQLANARQLDKSGAVKLVNDGASADQFYAAITELLDNPSQRQKLAKSLASQAVPDAAGKLAQILLQYAKHAE